MALRYVKFRLGDELVGDMDDGAEGYDLRVMRNPWRILMGTTQQGPRMLPAPLAAKEITFDRADVLYEGEVVDELADVYRQQHNMIVAPHGLHVPG